MAYIHDLHIVHRDIKADNVLLANLEHEAVRVKLADFGVAARIASTSRLESGLFSARGTDRYFSPERAQGRAYGLMSDMWALGCVLIELARCVRLEGSLWASGPEVEQRRKACFEAMKKRCPPLEGVVGRLLDVEKRRRMPAADLRVALADIHRKQGEGCLCECAASPDRLTAPASAKRQRTEEPASAGARALPAREVESSWAAAAVLPQVPPSDTTGDDHQIEDGHKEGLSAANVKEPPVAASDEQAPAAFEVTPGAASAGSARAGGARVPHASAALDANMEAECGSRQLDGPFVYTLTPEQSSAVAYVEIDFADMGHVQNALESFRRRFQSKGYRHFVGVRWHSNACKNRTVPCNCAKTERYYTFAATFAGASELGAYLRDIPAARQQGKGVGRMLSKAKDSLQSEGKLISDDAVESFLNHIKAASCRQQLAQLRRRPVVTSSHPPPPAEMIP